jgi:serine/threonine protein kinase
MEGAAAEEQVLLGPVVPGYEVLGLLGKGGMGVVYKARHLALNRIVALKMILHAEYADAEERRRFTVEAQAVAQLQHPHIVQIFDVGENASVPYYSLEFCPGGSLADKLVGVPLEAKPAAALVEKLAEAIHAAHQAQIIHRDLKPANVLLSADSQPKVTDFGLAKRFDEQGNTRSGAILGTPSYMAPEQAASRKDIGPPVDIYALGVILYECLTGRPPFQAATTVDIILQVLNEPPVPPSQLNPAVPLELEAICLRCLNKDPATRYLSALALAEELRQFQTGMVSPPASKQRQTPSPSRHRPRRRLQRLWLLTAGVAAGLAVLILSLVLLLRWRESSPPTGLFDQVRHDFEVTVEIPGATPGEHGEWHLFAERPVRFAIEVERDAYVGLWNIATDGTIMQIFPSRYEQDNFVKAGERRVVPGGDYRITAELSGDVERVWVMASTAPWDAEQGEKKGPFILSVEQRNKLETVVRGFRLGTVTRGGSAISEAAVRYRVVPAPSAGKP